MPHASGHAAHIACIAVAWPFFFPSPSQFPLFSLFWLSFGESLQSKRGDSCEDARGVTKNITNTHHAFVYILLCMSDKSWNMIPDDLRQPFLEGVKEGCDAERGYLVEANADATQKLKEKGKGK